nr:hypothetical protein [Photobacterium leiognathi]
MSGAIPPASSTKGYLILIGFPQQEDLPLSISQLINGKLWYQAILEAQ